MGTLKKILEQINQQGTHSALNRRKLRMPKKPRPLRPNLFAHVDVAFPEMSGAKILDPQQQSGVIPNRSARLFDYATERAAFARREADLMREHPEKYVVFVGEEMFGPHESFAPALAEAYQKYGRRPIYTKKLTADDSVR